MSEVNEFSDTKALFISIVGKPNVGKSSLLNMIIDYKVSIVSPKPQTTRNIINGILTMDNIQIVATDTPGIHKSNTLLGKYMDQEIKSSFASADACLHVIEAGGHMSDMDRNIISMLKYKGIPTVLAINKIDKIKKKSIIIEQIKDFISEYKYSAVVPVSARTKYGKEALIKEIKSLSISSQFFFPEDQLTNQSERKIISEIVREKSLKLLNNEVPHGIAVCVESMKNCKNGLIDINSTIYCDNERHKKIIIGKGGSMIKKIGTFARQDIEIMLNNRVNIKIWVKVKENWENKDSMLKLLNYI